MKDKHNNGHRKGKVRFEASLTPSEASLVDAAKNRIGAVNNKDLLLKLCKAL